MPRWFSPTLLGLTLLFTQVGTSIAATVAEFGASPIGEQRSYLLSLRDGSTSLDLTSDDEALRLAVRECTASLKTDVDMHTAFSSWLEVHPDVRPLSVPVAFVRWAIDICPSPKNAR